MSDTRYQDQEKGPVDKTISVVMFIILELMALGTLIFPIAGLHQMVHVVNRFGVTLADIFTVDFGIFAFLGCIGHILFVIITVAEMFVFKFFKKKEKWYRGKVEIQVIALIVLGVIVMFAAQFVSAMMRETFTAGLLQMLG